MGTDRPLFGCMLDAGNLALDWYDDSSRGYIIEPNTVESDKNYTVESEKITLG